MLFNDKDLYRNRKNRACSELDLPVFCLKVFVSFSEKGFGVSACVWLCLCVCLVLELVINKLHLQLSKDLNREGGEV